MLQHPTVENSQRVHPILSRAICFFQLRKSRHACALMLIMMVFDFVFSKQAEAKDNNKPNIIFILADDLGFGDLGCYGQKEIKTPVLDKMAKEGMKFNHFYAGSTVCAPSRCVLMTGLHTGHCLVRGNARVPLRPSDVTVAEVINPSGYKSALIGKWGLGEEGSTGVPTRQGFDYFFGYLNQHHAHNYYPAYLFRNEKRVQLKNVVPGSGDYGKNVATEKVEYSHNLFATEALQFIDKNKDNPFFLYLALTIPHANNQGGKKGMEVPSYGIYKDKSWNEPRKGHAAMISLMDRDIGRIFAKLKKLGIDENTIVIFTSDNGPHREGGFNPKETNSNGALRGIKRALYDGGIRVPMIARWPGKIKSGTVSNHVSYFADFLPTAAELTGSKNPKGLDGISFLPAMLGKKQTTHDFLYWEFFEGGYKQAVRYGKYKAIRPRQGAKLELYNIIKDEGEQKNIAGANPQVIERIENYLKTARTESKTWKVRPPRKKSNKQKK